MARRHIDARSQRTKARLALCEYVEAERGRLAAIARSLKISSAAVSLWCSGVNRPDAHFRQALQGLIGIPAEDWYTPAERRIAFAATGTDS